ncbi:hypothetical protein CC2G_008980 [Coprinopsis cinerea AmutBmut pab1-1]|nr:hypothetical protein CC2G_008980 [Coprinopsis cinerea AmutBmut pab1-1]
MGRRTTRSQVTLPDEILQVSQHSPMKQARMSRNAAASTSKTSPDDMLDVSGSEDELLLSPKKRANTPPPTATGKRSASPSSENGLAEGSPEEGRGSKRVKRDAEELQEPRTHESKTRAGTAHTRNHSDSNAIANKRSKRQTSRLRSEKPRSIASDQPLNREASLPPDDHGRAQSVPLLFPATYSYPHIDLANLPPSPTRSKPRSRSPSKSSKSLTPKMRITPLPVVPTRLPSIPDESTREMDVDQDAQSQPQETEVDMVEPSSETVSGSPKEREPPLKVITEVSIPLEPSDQVGPQEPEPVTPVAEDDTAPPLSPLTPAPETPYPVAKIPTAVTITTQETKVASVKEKTFPSKPAKEKAPPPAPPKIDKGKQPAIIPSKTDKSAPQPDKQNRLRRLTTAMPRPTKVAPRAMGLSTAPPTGNGSEPSSSKIPMAGTIGTGPRNAFNLLMNKAGSSKTPAAESKTSGFQQKVKNIFNVSSSLDKGKGKAGGIKAKMKGRVRPETQAAPALIPVPMDEDEETHANLNDEEPVPPTPDEDGQDDAPRPETSISRPASPPAHPTQSEPVQKLAQTKESIQPEVQPEVQVQSPEEAVTANDVTNPSVHPPTSNGEQDDTLIAPEPPQDVAMGEPEAELDVPLSTEPVTVEPVPPTTEEPEPEPAPANLEVPPEPGPSKAAALGKKRVPSAVPAVGRVTRSSSNRKAPVSESKPPVPMAKTRQTTLNFAKATRSASLKRKTPANDKATEDSIPTGDTAAPSISVKAKSKSGSEQKPAEEPTAGPSRAPLAIETSKSLPRGSPMKVNESPVRRSPRNLATSRSTPSLKTPSSSPAKLRKPFQSTTPGSPSKKLARSASMNAGRRSANLSENRFAKNGSTLSTLSNALEQLRMPAPSRPSTSMGFNRDGNGNSDDDDSVEPKSQTQDDSAVGKKTVGNSHSTGAVGRSATLGANHFSKATGLARPPGRGPFAGRAMRGRPLFGVGTGTLGRRHTAKASKNPTLPSVMGSPVKGGGDADVSMTFDDQNAVQPLNLGGPSNQNDSALVDDMDVEEIEVSNGKGKERATDSDEYSSRRASMASHFLAQSVSAFRESEAATTGGKGLMGPPPLPSTVKQSSNNSLPSTAATAGADDTSSNGTPPGRRSTRSAALAASQAIANVAASSRRAPPQEEKPSPDDALKFLKDCRIFVDVRTEEGEEAGSLFVEMLEVAGARLLQRPGQSCTHIVYKNGLPSTVNRYK